MGTLHPLPQPRQPAKPLGGVPQEPKPVLQRHVRLEVEQARCFLMHLGGKTAGVDLPAAMFLLGRLTEHAERLLDVIDATTALPR